jgi:hypothetical protein
VRIDLVWHDDIVHSNRVSLVAVAAGNIRCVVPRKAELSVCFFSPFPDRDCVAADHEVAKIVHWNVYA